MLLRQGYLVLLVLWIHLGDFISAWIYDGGAVPSVAMARPLRDFTVIVVAVLCLATTRMATSLVLPMAAYGALALASLVTSLAAGRATNLAVASFGTLVIPLLFFLVGYYCVRSQRDLRRLVSLYVVIAVCSVAFGMWEIGHTDFWIYQMHFPEYMADVKGLILGANPDTGLPWNFFTDTIEVRRAAGLLAAPLAQGMFLVIAGVLLLAWSQPGTRLTGAAITVFLALGVWMSGTRGAMLAGAIALTGYLAVARTITAHPLRRIGLAVMIVAGLVVATSSIIETTINLRDMSSPGHWSALKANLAGLIQIPLLGYGPGASGAIAAQSDLPMLGGGEGAIFTVAYQIGMLAAASLLIFYGVCMHRLWRAHRDHADDFAPATFWLMVGLAITLVTSEHILAVSGSAALWLMVGGQMRLLSRLRAESRSTAEAYA